MTKRTQDSRPAFVLPLELWELILAHCDPCEPTLAFALMNVSRHTAAFVTERLVPWLQSLARPYVKARHLDIFVPQQDCKLGYYYLFNRLLKVPERVISLDRYVVSRGFKDANQLLAQWRTALSDGTDLRLILKVLITVEEK
jgi:hypothetical protein